MSPLLTQSGHRRLFSDLSLKVVWRLAVWAL